MGPYSASRPPHNYEHWVTSSRPTALESSSSYYESTNSKSADWVGGGVEQFKYDSRINAREMVFGSCKQTSASLPQTCIDLSVVHGCTAGARPKIPHGRAKTPDLLRKLLLMKRGRHVRCLLAELHAGLGSSKTQVPSSTNGAWWIAPRQVTYLQKGAKRADVSRISLDGVHSNAIWIFKRGLFGVWMACSMCVWKVQSSLESGVDTGAGTAALVTPS